MLKIVFAVTLLLISSYGHADQQSDFTNACYDGDVSKSSALWTGMNHTQSLIDACLQYASVEQKFPMVLWSIRQGANANQDSGFYQIGSPLGNAIKAKDLQAFTEILGLGGKIDHAGCGLPHEFAGDQFTFPNGCLIALKNPIYSKFADVVLAKSAVQNPPSLLWLAVMLDQKSAALKMLRSGVSASNIQYSPSIENQAIHHVVIEHRDLDLAKALVGSGAYVQFRFPAPQINDVCGLGKSLLESPLGYATRLNDAEMVTALLSSQPNLKATLIYELAPTNQSYPSPGSLYLPAFISAAALGNDQALAVLLAQATPVKDSLVKILISSDKCEFASALHLAAANNKATTVQILLTFGFDRNSKTGVWKMVNDPDETSPGDFNALDLALKFGATEAAQILKAP